MPTPTSCDAVSFGKKNKSVWGSVLNTVLLLSLTDIELR